MKLVYYTKSVIPTWFRNNNRECEVGTSKLPENVLNIKTQPDGFRLKQGRIFAILEFFFFLVPLHSPISGKIVAINDEVKANPSLLYENPLDNWIIKVKPNTRIKDLKSKNLNK